MTDRYSPIHGPSIYKKSSQSRNALHLNTGGAIILAGRKRKDYRPTAVQGPPAAQEAKSVADDGAVQVPSPPLWQMGAKTPARSWHMRDRVGARLRSLRGVGRPLRRRPAVEHSCCARNEVGKAGRRRLSLADAQCVIHWVRKKPCAPPQRLSARRGGNFVQQLNSSTTYSKAPFRERVEGGRDRFQTRPLVLIDTDSQATAYHRYHCFFCSALINFGNTTTTTVTDREPRGGGCLPRWRVFPPVHLFVTVCEELF